MKKTKLTRSLMAACSIVALTAVMYGCGSGPSQSELDTAEAAAAAAEAEAAAAAEAQAAAEAEAAEAAEAQAAAEAEAAEAERAAQEAAAAELAAQQAAEEAEAEAAADLEQTQEAAQDAADAAMTASDNAEMSASSAEDATANLATLQTGADANADETGGNEAAMAARAAADEAAEAASDAADAAAEAADATVGADAEAALRTALNAQDAAEAAEATAAKMYEAAKKAAMTELHIDGTTKSVGDSSVDATTGMLTSGTALGEDRKITGLQADSLQPTRKAVGKISIDGVGDVKAQSFADKGTARTSDDEPYRQAVAADDVMIGKTLDTSDDMARLWLIDSRAGSKKVRVYVQQDANATVAARPGVEATDTVPANIVIRTFQGMTGQIGTAANQSVDLPTLQAATLSAATTRATTKLTSVGMHYMATERTQAQLDAVETGHAPADDTLDYTDEVAPVRRTA